MIKYARLILVLAVFTAPLPVQALLAPGGIAIVPPLQLPPRDFSVLFGRLSVIVGYHRAVYGLDIGGIGNITELNFVGIGISGIFNLNHGQTVSTGLQVAGLANINVNKARLYGLQLTAGMNINKAESVLVGLQVAPIGNMSQFTDVYGAQVSIINRAKNLYGLQIGLVNSAHDLHGVQIGLINFNETGLFTIAPILNIGF